MSNQIVISSGAKLRGLNGVITGTTGVLDSVPLGGANGVATLDSSGKVPVSQLPSSVVTYLGTWNAATNTPTLANGTGDAGDMYLCNVAGTVNFGAGPITFAVGDWVLYGSGTWQKSNGQNGTVTSVAVTESGDALTITGSPITTAGTINIGFAGTSAQYVAGNGSLVTFPTLISSIGLSMPSAFSVSNSPLTANGTIAVTGAGTTSQYIRGDGSLATYNPGGGGGGASQTFYFNGSVASGVSGYEQMSTIANTGASADFSVSSNGYIASFLTDFGSPNQLAIPAGNWNFEIYFNSSSSGGSPYFYVELYKYNGSTFTLISSNSANPEYITNGTSVDLYFTALTVPATTLSLTDRLAVRVYVVPAGRTITMHTQDSNLSEVITTFTTGITALNGLTAQIQNFAVGTSGSDFNISSVTNTHTFNLPTASSSNRGALSSADWTTFNGKQSQLNGTGFVKASGTTISYDNSTYLTTSAAASTYVPYTGATALVNLGTYNLKSNSLYAEGDGAFAGGGLLIKQYGSGVSSITGYNTISSQTSGFYFSASQGGSYKNFLLDPSSLTNVTTRTYTLPNASGTLALTSNLSSYVPYSGATTDVLLGSWALYSAGVQVTNGGLGVISTDGWLSASKGIFLTDTASGGNWSTGITNITARTSGLLITHNLGGGILNFNTSTTYTYNFPAADGTVALTSNLSSYLPLSGGTLTGALNGTSATFSSSVQAATMSIGIAPQTDKLFVYNASGTNSGVTIQQDGTGDIFRANGNSGANRFVVQQGGNVGIGTSSPQAKFSIGSPSAITIFPTYSTNDLASIGWNYFALGDELYVRSMDIVSKGAPDGTNGGSIMRFLTTPVTNASAAVERMRITSGGNVGIGTTSPSYKLDTYGTSGTTTLRVRDGNLTATAQILLECANTFSGTSQAFISGVGTNGGNNSIDLLFGTSSGGSSATEKLRITSGGNVFINATSGGNEKFNVTQSGVNWATAINHTNSTQFYMDLRYNGTQTGSIIGNGSSTAFNTTSDYRLKEDFKEINGLKKVSAIKVYDFKYKNSELRMDGVIAHELAEILPYAVTGEKDGENLQGVDYSKIVPVLVKAIQELETRLKTLENK
jgi:hypothetical protein